MLPRTSSRATRSMMAEEGKVEEMGGTRRRSRNLHQKGQGRRRR